MEKKTSSTNNNTCKETADLHWPLNYKSRISFEICAIASWCKIGGAVPPEQTEGTLSVCCDGRSDRQMKYNFRHICPPHRKAHFEKAVAGFIKICSKGAQTSLRTRIWSAALRCCSWWVTRIRHLFFSRPQMHLIVKHRGHIKTCVNNAWRSASVMQTNINYPNI